LHQTFDALAFVFFGERDGAVFFQDLEEAHGRRTCCFGGQWEV
jgi:hypothetical protein